MPGSGLEEGAGGPEAADEIIACAERTLAAASARIELHLQWNVPPDWPGRVGRRSTGWRVAVGVTRLVVKTWWKRAGRGQEFGQMAGAGFIEPVRGRYMIDYGSFATLFADGTPYNGRSGRPLRTLPPQPPGLARASEEQVFWLLRLLPGATDARPEGSGTLHGTVCQKLAGHVDMARASAASGGGLRSPAVERFEDLHALPVTVWIDGQHVRRIDFEHTGSRPLTAPLTRLDLWDFGVPVDELDWSRLPAFRSRGHADR